MIRQDWSSLKKLLFYQMAAGGGAAVEATATGNPLTFVTDLARPLKSLLIPFTPQQSGTGDPSPENIRSIIPWNGLTVFGGGKNLFDESEYQHIYTDPDYIWEGVPYRCKYIQLSPNTNYTISSRAGTTSDEIVLINNRQQPNVMPFFDLRNASQTITFKTDETGRLYIGSVNGDDASTYNRIKDCKIQIEVGSSATAYEPYVPITDTDIVFPSPVYGGTLDVVSGVLTVERAVANLNSESAWGSYGAGDGFLVYVTKSDMQAGNRLPGYCDMFPSTFSQTGANIRFGADDNVIRVYNISTLGITDLSEWKEFIGTDGINVCYPLATPQEIQLTGAQLTALVGDNTIWSDADGSLTAVYLVSSKYAEDHPVGGLSSGLGSGLLGSGIEDPEEPIEDPEENPEE